MIATRYNKTVGGRGSGQFNIDTAVSHVISSESPGYTICGIRIGKSVEHGGRWERSNYGASHASCKRCVMKRKQERQS